MTGAASSTTTAPTEGERLAYYAGALAALRFFEGRRPTGRRFGPDADARWRDFAGQLGIEDRLDLLLRDADLEWSGALGARRAFGLDGVADDDAFGAAWESLPPAVASELWRANDVGPIAGLRAFLDAFFGAHRRTLAPITLAPVAPTHRVLVAGPSALASVVLAFESKSELDFGQQVLVVPGTLLTRQLGALAPALLATGTPSRFASHTSTGPWSATYISDDASEGERDHYAQLVRP